MGSNFANDLANTTGITLEQQLVIHFSTNCYPPIPVQMVDVAVKAINAVEGLRLDGWTTNYGEGE